MSGFDLLTIMKADVRLRSIPVVILATLVISEDVTRAYSLFASSCIVKSAEFTGFHQQMESFVKFLTHNRLPNWPTPAFENEPAISR